jgi:hypothetical protein
MKKWIPLLAAALALTTYVSLAAARTTDGRQLTGAFCMNPNALPKPMACIQLSFDGRTVQGYTGSTERTISLQPGTYWLTVDDNSPSHNFSLENPDGVDQDVTGVADAPGSVTVKVHLTRGRWVLFCDPHRSFGMYVNLEVRGDGQAD